MIDYPPAPPVVIVIGGQVLQGWTTMQLQRTKQGMTGSLTVQIFFGFVPKGPVLTGAKAGKEVLVYIGGHLAFRGTLDKRKGNGKQGKQARGPDGKFAKGGGDSGGSIKTHIGPNEYKITLTARGKTKDMVDSSQTHKTGSIKNAKTKKVVEETAKPFKVPIEWLAPEHDMGIYRFHDGAIAQKEIDRVANEYGLFRYETRDGKLRVTDRTVGTGEPLILGDNILEFDAEQSEDQANSPIKVKGQRTDKTKWGKEAVNRIKTVKDSAVKRHRPITVQHETDATDEALDRRAKHEANTRNMASKELKIKVFHVQPRTGGPWDLGQTHYVEVPTEGIAGLFECTGITYHVDAEKTLNTELTLNPPGKDKGGGKGSGSSASSAGGAGSAVNSAGLTTALAAATQAASLYSGLATLVSASGSGLLDVVSRVDWAAYGAARLAQLGITYAKGQYPEPWEGADLSDVSAAEEDEHEVALSQTLSLLPSDEVPMTLPAHLRNLTN